MAKGFSFEEALQPPEKQEPAGFSFEDALAKPTERTLGEALVTDPITSLLSGTGSMLGSPGQLKQLITGEKPSEEKPKGTIESLAQTLLPFGTDYKQMPEKVLQKLTPTAPSIDNVTGSVLSPFQSLQPVGEELKAFGEKQKSAGLKASEKGRETAISQQEGFLPELGTAVSETVTNPALLSNFIFEQIPNFVGTLGGGSLTKEMVKGLFKNATEKTLERAGVTGAVLTGGAMQAGDIGSETYQMIYDRLVKEGTPADQAHQIALEKGRMAAAQAGAISVASSFIPGGKALEKRFLTQAGKKAGFPGMVPAVGNVLGEATQEGVEEGGGRLVSNLQAQQVFPEINPMKGVGAATGLGALGGGMFGGVANLPSALSRIPQAQPTVGGAVPPSGAEPIPSGGAGPVPPTAPGAIPTQVKPLEQEIDPTEARLMELQNEFEEINKRYSTATPDQFAKLNAIQGRIKSEMSQLIAEATQAPPPATPAVTPPPAPQEVVQDTTQAKPVEAKNQKTELQQVMEKEESLESPSISKNSVVPHAAIKVAPYKDGYVSSYQYTAKSGTGNGITTPLDLNAVYPTKQEAINAAAETIRARAELDKNKTALNWLDTVSQVEQPKGNVKLTSEDYSAIDRALAKEYDERDDVDEAALDKGFAFLKENTEDIKAPPFKKGYTSSAVIHLAPFHGGYVSTGSYMGPTGGYGSSPHPTDNIYATRQDAINAEIDRMRGYALSYEDPKALVWLSDIDPRMEKFTEAEAKRQVNVSRQDQQKKRDEEYAKTQKLTEKWYPILQKYGWDGIGEFNNEIMITTEDQFIKDHGEDVLDELNDKDIVSVHSPSYTGQLNKVGKQYEDTNIVWATLDTVPYSVSKSQAYKDKSQAKFEAETAEEEEVPAPKVEKKAPKPVAKKPTKEEKVAANKERQAEKKAAAAKAKEPVDTSAVPDADKIRKKNGYVIYKQKSDMDYWRVQSVENKLANRIGEGDSAHSDLGTAEDKIYNNINEEESKPQAKPAVEKKEAKPAGDFEVGEYVLHKEPAVQYKGKEPFTSEKTIRAKITAIKTNGDLELKSSEGYFTKPPSQVIKENKPVEAKKPSTAVTPKVDEEWAEHKQELTTKPSRMDQDVWDKYQRFQKGDFAFSKTSFIGANALARANAANKAAKETYDKAAREFLNHEISAKAPAKNAPKLDVSDTHLVAVPAPIAKNIKVAKTLEDQKKAMMTIAADKKEHRKMLQGILIEPDKMVVTDGHRLALYKTNTGVAEKTLLDKDGKVIDMQYLPYDRILEKARNATSYGMVNATALGNYARGTRKAWKYISANANSPFSVQLKDGKKVIPFNGNYIEDMANMFRQFGYDGFDIQYNDGNMLIGVSPDGKLTQVVMGMKDVNWVFMPFNVNTGAPGVTKLEPDVIDIQATEITEDQVKLLTNETKKLSKEEMATLEAHYGYSSETKDFLKMLREDIINYVNKGADAVDAAVRDIIAKLQAGVLAVAMVFNPAYMSQQSAVVYPSTVTTEQVKAVVPEFANDMSESGKKAFASIFPAIKPSMAADNKLFTIVDKPTSKVYVFNPDGTLLTKDNVVLGMALGDTYVGGTDFKGNRVTPAGLFKVKGEKGSGTYDGKTIYTVGNVQEGWNTAFMHTVYLKESDAQARKQALATGEKTRLSHGCVNASPEVMAKIGEGNRMDGSHVFVVPDNQAKVDDYIANNVSNEDLTRVTVTPVTEQVPVKQAAGVKGQEVVGREEKAIEPKTKAQINRERQLAKMEKEEPTGTFYNNFDPEFTEQDFDNSVNDVRKEKIKEQAVNSRRITKTVKRIADMGSDLASQFELNRLMQVTEDLDEEIGSLKQAKNLPEDFLAKAMKESAENQRNILEGLSPEAAAVVQALYQKFPNILNGLKLSVRATEKRGVSGNFDPIERLVTVYKHGISAIFGKAGEKQARTMRHEITHSLEQMMTPEVKKVLVDAWAKAFGKAIETNKDEAHQNYFQAVMDFIENPNEATYKKATDLLPNYNMYQFISPSEFWAVNAEPMMAAKLGGAWTKFVNGVKGLWEAIKSVFGFDNRYAVHREFNRIMAGDQKRINKQMLVDYLNQNGVTGKFINNIEEDLKLIDDLNLPEVPDNDPKTFKDMMVGNYQRFKRFAEDLSKQPGQKFTDGLTSAYENGTMARIQAVNYAAGVEARDFAKYKGQVRTADNLAIASLAVKNNLHAAMIAARVITQGALTYNKDVLRFIAIKSDKSIANVIMLQKKLRKEMGKKVADKIINAFFTAKRSRSIQNSYFDRSNKVRQMQDKLISTVDPDAQRKVYKDLFDAQKELRNIIVAYQKIPVQFRALDEDGNSTYETIMDENDKETKIPILNDEAIDRAISASKRHPELQQMMDNWTAVNHNILDNMFLAGRISAKQLESLKAIKDYSPWYRVMNDDEDVFDSSKIQMNSAGVKHFRPGEVDRNMDNVVDGMIHNVTAMTRGLIRNYANVRIAQEYGTRYEEGKKAGKLMVFASEGKDATGLRLPVYMSGSRVIIKVEDDLVSSAVLGMAMGPVNYPFKKVLGAASNLFRRSITFSGFFQIKQVFYDAPTAAWISGVRRPDLLFAHCFTGFVRSLNPASTNPTIELIKNAGFGGLQSHHRTAKGEMDLQLGVLDHNHFSQAMKFIDMVGDASDLSQRIPTFDRVFKETDDKALALMMAADVIDFNKHGLHPLANFLRSSVTFLQAYATQADVFAMAMVGGNIKGKARGEAAKNFYYTGLAMASIMVGYTLLCCADDDYFELDDQTKARNLYIPFSKKTFGYHVLIPLHSTAATFFKVMPELAVNYIITKGTKNEMDRTRLGRAAGEAMVDSLFGPTPIPTGVKPFVEIGLNHNFFTGSTVTPKGMEGLKEAQQYNASTSELGKFFSALTTIPFTSEKDEKYTEGKRLLNPIEADHLMRSIGGSVATMAMYGTNMMFSENRVSPETKDNPLTAGILGREVPRRNEDLFYDLKERSDREYKSYMDLIKTERFDDADRLYKANEKLIDAHGYVTDIDNAMKALNSEIRRISRVEDKNYSPQEKRKDINKFQKDKMDILEDIIEIRKEAGL